MSDGADPASFAAAVRCGERGAVARCISGVERGDPGMQDVLRGLQPFPAHAYRIGLTGPPGAGKSTLTLQLVRALRVAGGKVGVLAVDPSSPFSGGALLGDRVRMNDVAGDAGVFIRSFATRGALGGLSAAVADAADVLDAAGFDHVLVETVGVGQSECDIVRLCDTTVVVLTPESGDEIQVAKAGLMEIADLFVINKDDRPGADRLRAAVRAMLDQARARRPDSGWYIPILRTMAQSGAGVAALVAALHDHRRHQERGAELRSRRRQRRHERVLQLAAELLGGRLWSPARLESLQQALDAGNGQQSARVIAQRLVEDFFSDVSGPST